jgi:hypothetical protein
MDMAKYDPLRHYLQGSSKPRLELTFKEIEEVVDSLPKSALDHSAWWSNEIGGRHVQAPAWLEAGYKVESIDLIGRRVRFSRS